MIGTNRDGTPTDTLLVVVKTNVLAETPFNRPPARDENLPVDLISAYPVKLEELKKHKKNFHLTSKFQFPSFDSKGHNSFY